MTSAIANRLQFAFDPVLGCWSIHSEDERGFQLDGAQTRLHLDGNWVTLFKGAKPAASGGKVILEDRRGGLAARMTVSFPPGAPAAIVEVELRNASTKDMVLGPLHLLEVERFGGAFADDALKVYVESGGGWWAGVVDAASTAPCKEQWDLLPAEDKVLAKECSGREGGPGFHNSMGGLGVLVHPRSPTAFLAGFLTFKRACANVTWLYRKGAGGLRGWAGCDYAGFRLPPGGRIISEKLFLGFWSSPFTALENYAALSGKLMKARFPALPPLGYCSWYAYRLKITEEILLENARLIRKHFGGYPFKYIQVDHGWQYQNSCGNWTETNERFPRGVAWLAGELRKLGLTLGLWQGVFCVLEESPLMKAHPEYMIRNPQGEPLAMPYRWFWPPNGRVFYLDPTHPGAQRFLRETFGFLRKAGCRYWKVDFTWGIANNARDAVYHDPHCVKGAETYRKGCAVVQDAVKDDYLYWCSNPVNLGYGLSPTSMSACDIGNTGFSLARRIEGRTEDVDFFRRNLTTLGSRYFFHKRLFLINPDVVEVGGEGDLEEGKIRLSLVALTGGQVFLGDVLPSLKAKHWELLEKCIPPYGEAARPVDLFEHTHPKSYPQIWHLPVRTAWGKWDVVGLFNLRQEPLKVAVDFRALGLSPDRDYLVYEFWGKRLLGICRNGIAIALKPLTTQLLCIRDIPAHPMVLSTDMHFTQGGVDLPEVAWDERTGVLRGVAKRQKGSRGNVYLYVPQGYAPGKGRYVFRRGLLIVPLRFARAEKAWRVRFRKRSPHVQPATAQSR